MFFPLSALVLLPTSLLFHLSVFIAALLLFHLLLPFLCRSQTQIRSLPTSSSRLPLTPTHVLILPLLSLPHLDTSCFIFAFTHTPSTDSYSRGKYSVQQRIRLTVPYVVFALRCALTFFCNWIISLAANPTSVVLGDFTTSYLPFTSVWTYTFCRLQK